jgi:RNA 3'-terminal phosphate cyclase (ATP)
MVTGRAIAAELPSHIAQRMSDRATARLRAAGLVTRIVPQRLRAACPGAGIFLTAEYEGTRCGFSDLGRIGKPAEAVADEAVDALLYHHSSRAAVDEHLSDQLLVPFALADGMSRMVVDLVSRHLKTNAWVIEQFGLARVEMLRRDDGATIVTVVPSPAG